MSPLVESPVLQEILATGQVLLPSGERVPVSSQIDPRCGALLQECIAQLRPRLAVEVGLAYGISTLYILDALRAHGDGRLIGMDPAQFDAVWRGGGLHNIRRAGHAERYEFHEEISQTVLPRMVSQGAKPSLGFIDGWHTFDHTLVDFFHIDQMLEVGGIVVFDDVGYPAIRRACEFIIANRDYEIVGTVEHTPSDRLRRGAKRLAWNLTLPLHRTNKTPRLPVRERLAALENVYFLALRKTAHDARRFDHFVHF